MSWAGGAVSSNFILGSSMWQKLTQTLEMKSQPEKECHLPRLPGWHEMKWTFDHGSDSEESIEWPQGGGG